MKNVLLQVTMAQILFNYNLCTVYKTFHSSRMTSEHDQIIYNKVLQYTGWAGISSSHLHMHLCAVAPFLQGEERYCAYLLPLDNTHLSILQSLVVH